MRPMKKYEYICETWESRTAWEIAEVASELLEFGEKMAARGMPGVAQCYYDRADDLSARAGWRR